MARGFDRTPESRRLRRDLYDLADFWADRAMSELDEDFRDGSLAKFVGLLGPDRVRGFMEAAIAKLGGEPEQAIRYLCGCCWKTIRAEGL